MRFRDFATRLLCVLTTTLVAPTGLDAQSATAAYTAEQCPSCAAWNKPHAPVKLFGNTYWVGTDGLGAVLITSDAGHILIDGALPESAPLIEANIRALGFRMADVRYIANSHVHYDHAGGIAALQRASGARVVAMPAAAEVLTSGRPDANDPQHAIALGFPTVPSVRVINHGDTLRVGSLAIVAHLTPGHAPGGTTWTWRSCEGTRCIDVVYADSQTPVSADAFRFSDSKVLPDFELGLSRIEALRCDLLISPHPSASQLWQRLAAREAGDPNALFNTNACRGYAANGRTALERRLTRERGGK